MGDSNAKVGNDQSEGIKYIGGLEETCKTETMD